MIKEKLDYIYNSFINFFSGEGYLMIPEEKISSGVDCSVSLIGSGISVLKPFFLNDNIPDSGLFICQKAIRTQPLKNIYDIENVGEFNSFFDSFCVLEKYQNLFKLFKETEKFFRESLGISCEDLMFKVSSSDEDLLDACSYLDCLVEIDTHPTEYYRHKYGLDELGIYGRNINFALRNPTTKEFKDVGNIIVVESSEKKYGVELAFGVQTVALSLFGLNNTLKATYVADYLNLNSPAKFKYADCLIVVTLLENEDIMNCKKRYPKYLYKRYLRALLYWKGELHIDDETFKMHKKKFWLLETYKVQADKE